VYTGFLSIIRSLVQCIQYRFSVHHHESSTMYTPDDGQKTSPKHVEFYCKNKFEKLVHLVGFIILVRKKMRYIREPA
jgi:hypothetical protein